MTRGQLSKLWSVSIGFSQSAMWASGAVGRQMTTGTTGRSNEDYTNQIRPGPCRPLYEAYPRINTPTVIAT